ncbi:MAG: alpha/beta hydrolase [Pseudomonadota bacterium]
MTWTTQLGSDASGDLASYSTGRGPALALLHGVGLRSEAWAPITPLLQDHFTIHVFDMPGHGNSPLNGAKDFKDYADRLEAALQKIDGPIALAGHSMGAMLALELADRLPDRVMGVAALNAIFRRSSAAREAVQARAADLPEDKMADPSVTLERWFGSNPTGPKKEARDACYNWLTRINPLGYKRAYTVFAKGDGPTDQQLTSLEMPALFLTGAGDPNSTPQMSEAMATLAPKGTAKTIPDAAHMLPMTHPKLTADLLIQTFKGGH